MKVNEIFLSIEGEGKRAGLPAVFVRFFGCNMTCSYCDTVYSCKGNDYKEMSIDEIIEEMDKYHCNNVTVTGGEPLIHEGMNDFLERLLEEGYDINVETNGSVSPTVRSDKSVFKGNTIFYTMDYKCPSSEMESFMDIRNFIELDDDDVLKFVVGSQDDLIKAHDIIMRLEDEGTYPQIYFSPVFGAIEPKEIVTFLLEHHLYHCKVQLQLHKYIFPINMRGV